MGRISLLREAGKRVVGAWHALRGTAREDWDDYFGSDFPVKITKAGTKISEGNALTISGLFAALNFLSSTIASLPRMILRRLPGGGHEKAVDHPLYDRLHNKPNSTNMTAWQWIYTSLMGKYLWGNWYTLISSDGELTPLSPGRTWRDPDNIGIYHTLAKDGKEILIPARQLLHIPHISLDGVTGKGIVHYARESLGLAKAQDEFAATFFGSGIHPGGFVLSPGEMKEDVRQGLQKDFNELYGGLGRNWKAIFLTGGAQFKESEVDASKAQALESRQFSIVEIARWANLPPHILRDLVRATFSNIEQQGIELVIYSLLPLTTQTEQAMNITLFAEKERREYFVKFELKGLLRGDLAARTAFYNAMLDRGVFNADTVLELEDMNPQPDGLGQAYFLPLNFVNKENAINPMPLTIEAPRAIRVIESPPVRQIAENRSSALRRKITQAYKKQFDAYGQQIIGEEVKWLREIVTETLAQRDSGNFLELSDKFYSEFSRRVDQAAAPLLASYAESILPIAQEEIKSEAEIDPQYQQFLAQYREYFARRHVDSSRTQLRAIIQQAQDEELDAAELLEQRLVEWEEKRPAKIGMRESLRAENAFTRQVFVLCGISKIMSVAYGKNCPYCSSLDGRVIGIDENFLSKGDFQPDGATEPLKITSDHSHPPYHDGCLPGYSRILAEGISSASKRWYDGDLVIIYTSQGHKLAITPNHPILTPQGWINSGFLNVGNYIISNMRGQRIQFGNGNGKNTPSRIEDIAESLLNDPQMVAVPVPTAAKDFHGDGKNSKVAIVGTNRLLWDTVYSPLMQQGAELSFGKRYTNAVPLPRLRGETLFGERLLSAGGGNISRSRLGLFLRGRHFASSYYPGFAIRTERDLAFPEVTGDYTSIDSERQRQAIDRLSGQIAPDKIVSIKRDSFHGYVFNLQTKYGFYFADNIIAHNCDCGIVAGM